MNNFLVAVIFALLAVGSHLYVRVLNKTAAGFKQRGEVLSVKVYWLRVLMVVLEVLFAWLFVGYLLSGIFPPKTQRFEVEVFAPMVNIAGLDVSSASVWGFAITLILIALCAVFYFFAVPKFTDAPKGLQNFFELLISSVDDFTKGMLHHPLGANLTAYVFALGAFLVGCAAVELLGVRSPTSDLMTTFALALVTFFLINYYGIKEKGLKGRAKDFANPSPVMAPIKIITDMALPVSMACRLFGNMLAGLIIMELIYYALGNLAVGIPAVVGLYFNLFHPAIQAFIFMTLTLSFINEATE